MGRINWASAPVLAPQISIPEPPQTDNPALNDWMRQVQQAMQQIAQPNVEAQNFLDDLLATLNALNGSQSYTVTNNTGDRALDADSTSIDELADVLGTLISDLRTVGVVR